MVAGVVGNVVEDHTLLSVVKNRRRAYDKALEVVEKDLPEMSPRRLYMDNPATSFPKPATVMAAMARYATELGASAGRGVYSEAVETGAALLDCRRRLNRLFNG